MAQRGSKWIAKWRGGRATSVAAAIIVLPILSASVWVPKDDIAFRVMRDGESIGRHSVSFERSGEVVRVAVNIALEVRFAFMTVFRYEHHNEETWRNGRLISLKSRTNDDGEKYWVKARATADGLEVTGSSGNFTAPADMLPTSYWNPATVEQDRLLDTQSGRIVRVEIEPVGREEVSWGGRTVQADKYVMRGDLDLAIWYTPRGEWVRLAFTARGSEVAYARLGGDKAAAAARAEAAR